MNAMTMTHDGHPGLDVQALGSELGIRDYITPIRFESRENGLRGYAPNGELCFAYTTLQDAASRGRKISCGYLLKTGEWLVRILR